MTITKNRAGNGRGNSGASDASVGSMKTILNMKQKRAAFNSKTKKKQLEKTINEQKETIKRQSR